MESRKFAPFQDFFRFCLVGPWWVKALATAFVLCVAFLIGSRVWTETKGKISASPEVPSVPSKSDGRKPGALDIEKSKARPSDLTTGSKEKQPESQEGKNIVSKNKAPESQILGNNNVISKNQSGGQTAGVINNNTTINNYAPSPLQISQQQSADLSASLAHLAQAHSGINIPISMHNANAETARFGNSLAEALRKVGFAAHADSMMFIGATLDRGVTLRFGVEREPLAIALRDALLGNGIVTQVYRSPGISPDDFLVIIAP